MSIDDLMIDNQKSKGNQDGQVLGVNFIPRKMLLDRSYRESEGRVKNDLGDYFDSCALDVEEVLNQVYGNFERKIEKRDGMINYSFKKPDISISYLLQGDFRLDVETSEYGGGAWFNDVRGYLTIFGKNLNLENAGQFLDKVFENNLIEYDNDRSFKLFYSSSSEKIDYKGDQLLEKLNVKPTEVAYYSSIMGFGVMMPYRATWGDGGVRFELIQSGKE